MCRLTIMLLLANLACFGQNIIIRGISGDPAVKRITLNRAAAAGIVTLLDSANVALPTAKFELKCTIQSPIFAFINNFPVFLTPGDTVQAYIKGTGLGRKDSIFTEGKNAGHYMFFSEYAKIGGVRIFRTATDYSFQSFKSTAFKNYQNDLRFLDNYKIQHQLSAPFVDAARKAIKFNYYSSLFSVNYDTGNKNKLKDLPASYFDFISKEDFHDDKNINIPGYFFSLTNYNYYLTDSISKDSLYRISPGYLKALFKSASGFTGLTREYLCYSILKTYATYTGDQYFDVFTSAYLQARTFIKDALIREKLEAIYDRYNSLNKSFPDDVGADMLSSTTGKSYSLKDLLEIHKGKVIYIDFWASWCEPCIREMPNSKRLLTKLQNSEVVFLYISIDQDKDSWMNGLAKIGTGDKNFLLAKKGANSALFKYLNLSAIPRYVILDKNGKLADKFAPSPGDPQIEKIIRDHLK